MRFKTAYTEKSIVELKLPFCFLFAENRSWFIRTFNTGGIDRADPDNPIDNQEHCLMAFFKNTIAKYLNKGWIKALVLLVFAVYLSGACYGLTQIEEGLERRKLSKEDSYSVKFFDLEDEYYREFPYRIQVIISGVLNYSDPIVQSQMEELTSRLENTSYVTSSLYTESWLRSFLSFIERNNDFLNVTIDNELDFISALKEVSFDLWSLVVSWRVGNSSKFIISALAIPRQSILAGREIQRRPYANCGIAIPHPSGQHNRHKSRKGHGQGFAPVGAGIAHQCDRLPSVLCVFRSIRTGATDVHSIDGDRCTHHDADLLHFHSKHFVLTLGGLQHCVN